MIYSNYNTQHAIEVLRQPGSREHRRYARLISMKTLIILTVTLLLLNAGLVADDLEKFPDMSRAFPKETLIRHIGDDYWENYVYAIDSEFAVLTKSFRKFLGEGWKETVVVAKERKKGITIRGIFHTISDPSGLATLGRSSFSSPDFPGVYIGLSLVQKQFESNPKKHLTIVVVRRNAEQDGADNPATAPPDNHEDENR